MYCTIQHEEVFFDASTVVTMKKKWKKLDVAEPTDSRVVWQHVTEAILRDDEQAAADNKHKVCAISYNIIGCTVHSNTDSVSILIVAISGQ